MTLVWWSWPEQLSVKEWMIEHNFETKIFECDVADSEIPFLLQLAGAFSSRLSNITMLSHCLVLSWGREAPSEPSKYSGRKLVPVSCVAECNFPGWMCVSTGKGWMSAALRYFVCSLYIWKSTEIKLAHNKRALSGIAWNCHFIS